MPRKVKVVNATEFSRKISEYVSASGLTVYKISQITGLGRTAIQHAMSGDMIPTREFYEKLCTAFQITPQQKSELTEMYLKVRYGEKTYNERKSIKEIIENLPQYYINRQREPVFYGGIPMPNESGITGLLNVNQAIISIIGKELEQDNPQIFTTIPFENKQLFDVIMQMFGACNKKADIEHYFRIFKNDSDISCGNIETLKNALMMSMNVGIIYNPYCYYAYREAVDDNLPLFPYCLITSEYVIMVSADFKSASVSSEQAVIEMARNHIAELKRKSKLMIELIDNKRMFDIFAESSKMFDKSIEFQPCVTKYLTMEIISKRLEDIPEREYILDVLQKSFFVPEQLEKAKQQKALNVFSRKGLEHFAETGRMINMPGHMLKALSAEERIYILECMKNDVGSYYKMLDDSKLSVPQFLQIIYLNNHSCLISCLMEDRKFCCKLTEQGLCSSIDDFIGSLSETDFTVDDSEFIAVIDSCIEKLRVQGEKKDEK